MTNGDSSVWCGKVAAQRRFAQKPWKWRAFSPVADEARVALVDVHNSLGVDVEADEDAAQQVAGRRTQRSHHVHDG